MGTRMFWLGSWLIVGWFIVDWSSAAVSQSNQGWLTFEKCAVHEEFTLEIPALERGFLKTLHVQLNQAVTAGQVLAELDTDLAELDLRIAQLEYAHASERARDNGDIEFQQLALQEAGNELSRNRLIKESVSESEIRRLTLLVEQAKLALDRASKAQRNVAYEAQLKGIAVEAAEERLARRRIIAPQSGVITEVRIHPGQAVDAGQTILKLYDLEYLVIDHLIPVSDLHLSTLVGSLVRVDIAQNSGTPLRLSGKITSFDQRVSAGGLVRVHARVKNLRQGDNWVLLPGQEVTMMVSTNGEGVVHESNLRNKPQPAAVAR